jgi:hypothetical protein
MKLCKEPQFTRDYISWENKSVVASLKMLVKIQLKGVNKLWTTVVLREVKGRQENLLLVQTTVKNFIRGALD